MAAASMTIGTTKKGLHADRYCQYTFLSTLPSALASLCAGSAHCYMEMMISYFRQLTITCQSNRTLRSVHH